MIDINESAIVAERRTSDGRFLLFTSTDLPPDSVLPWSSVMADIWGDGAAFMVRLDGHATSDGFTLLNLLDVAARRAAEEVQRRPTAPASGVLSALHIARSREALRLGPQAADNGFGFDEEELPPDAPYRMTGAWQGDNALPLCCDPAGQAEGVTLEQVLIVCEQLCIDACRRLPRHRARPLVRIQAHITEAIRYEVKRSITAR
ncbi:MAG: hypothetical protein ACLGJC_16415 [Alphaproteobacteria bacterium]